MPRSDSKKEILDSFVSFILVVLMAGLELVLSCLLGEGWLECLVVEWAEDFGWELVFLRR